MQKSVCVLAVVLWANAAQSTYSFSGLGQLPNSGPGAHTDATGVSEDGLFVSGHANPGNGGQTVAVRWHGPGNFEILGVLPGGYTESFSRGISSDGSVIIGDCAGGGSSQGFRWTQAGGMIGLGDLPGGSFGSGAKGLSADGSVVVGTSSSALYGDEAYRWTASTGMVALGTLQGGGESYARAVSPDGNTVAGFSGSNSSNQAFRWQANTGMQSLGTLPGGEFYYSAYGVSSGGAVITGRANNETIAFRWVNGVGSLLGTIPGSTSSEALAISADGLTIVGVAGPTPNKAMLWHPAYGMIDVKQFLIAHGVDGLAGWQLYSIRGISRNGRFIVGYGFNPEGKAEAWHAEIDLPVLPRAFTVTVGYQFDGDIESIYRADGDSVCLFPNEDTYEGEINVFGTCPVESPQEFTYSSTCETGRPGLSQTLRLRNYETGNYDLVDGRIAPTTPTLISVTMSSNPASYVGPGRALRARMNWGVINDESPAQDGWLLCVDSALWTVSP